MKLRTSTVLQLLKLAEEGGPEAQSAQRALAAAHTYSLTLPTRSSDRWLVRLLGAMGRDVGVVVWQRDADAVIIAPDEGALVEALWLLATWRLMLRTLADAEGLTGAAEDMAAQSLAEFGAERMGVDMAMPAAVGKVLSGPPTPDLEALRAGALVGRWLAREGLPLRRTLPRRLMAPVIISRDPREYDTFYYSFRLKPLTDIDWAPAPLHCSLAKLF